MAARIAVKFTIFSLLVATAHCSSGLATFSYGVSDPNTGDIKDQHEKREGGNVVGKYSLLESDGTKRIVEYSASDATGFNAVVHKEPVGGINALAHGGLAAGSIGHGGLNVAAPAIHPAPIAHRPSLATGAFGHGSQNAISYANSNIINPALAHGSLAGHATGLAGNIAGGYSGHAASTVSHYSNPVVHNVRSYAGQYAGAYGGHGAQAAWAQGSGLGYGSQTGWAQSSGPGYGARGGLAAPFAKGSLGYGHGSSSAGSLTGSLAGGYAGHGAPAVSHYANTIVHDVRPYNGQYTGAYGGYRNQDPWAQGAGLGHGSLGGLGSTLAHGSLASSVNSGLSHGGWNSPLASGGFGAGVLGAGGANAGWSW